MGNKDIFVNAINKNQALLYKVASFYTDCKDDRDDLVQEIVYQMWRSFGSFDNRSSLTTWMYRVALNTAIYYLKDSKRRVFAEPINEGMLQYPELNDPELEERYKLLHQHISSLNLLERGIIMLYLEGKSHVEISGLIGISVSNVGTRIARIKDKLKLQLLKINDHGIR